MAVNRVDYNNNTLIDLTSDTVTAADLPAGVTAHDRSGTPITGTANYQPRTMDSSVTIGAETETTVEGAIGELAGLVPSSASASNKLAAASDIAAKQDALTFDNAPTQNSNNPVKSGGVYTALAGKSYVHKYSCGLIRSSDFVENSGVYAAQTTVYLDSYSASRLFIPVPRNNESASYMFKNGISFGMPIRAGTTSTYVLPFYANAVPATGSFTVDLIIVD